jgi:hypothetical protein
MRKESETAKMKGKLVLIPMGKDLMEMTNAEIDEWAGKIWDELPKPSDLPTAGAKPHG